MATGFRGAIFDVDGVTQWSDVQPHTSYSPERFTPQVYQQVMSGKRKKEPPDSFS